MSGLMAIVGYKEFLGADKTETDEWYWIIHLPLRFMNPSCYVELKYSLFENLVNSIL